MIRLLLFALSLWLLSALCFALGLMWLMAPEDDDYITSAPTDAEVKEYQKQRDFDEARN